MAKPEFTKDQKRRLEKARIQLVLDQPFFGSLIMKLVDKVCTDPKVKTAGVTPTNIYWNTEALDNMSDAEIKGVMGHEVMHVANGHCWRRGSRDLKAWNVACDKAINPILKEAKLIPPGDLLMPGPGEENSCAEHMYHAPPPDDGENDGDGDGEGDGNDPGGCGEVMDSDDGDTKEDGEGNGQGQQPGEAPPQTPEEQEADWKVAVANAAEQAKSQGKLPAGLERAVEEFVDPAVPWQTLLQEFVTRTARNDYNWTRPNRRYLSQGIILPTLVSDELPAIVIAVDTSGSIGKRELDAFAAEVSAVLGAFETTIHVIYVDAEVAHHHTVTRAELPLVLEPKGGGGTDFRPAFDWVTEQGHEPAALIYLTDMCGSFPSTGPDYPTLWISTSEIKEAPFGDVVKMVINDK